MPSISRELKRLKEEGKRNRYGGFWLYDTPRDRIVADFIDRSIVRQDFELSEAIKDFLYELATGQKDELALIRQQLEEMNLKLKSGAIFNWNGDLVGEISDEKGVLDALMGMED